MIRMIHFFKNLFFKIFGSRKKSASIPKVKAPNKQPSTPLIDPSMVPKFLRKQTPMQAAQVDYKKYRVVGKKFLGELFPKRKDANYEKAHLRAYLAGKVEFTFGYFWDRDGQRHPATHAVKFKYITERI